ncbi:MAG: PIN domain-containing protein [Thermoanaerobaculia bacterium]
MIYLDTSVALAQLFAEDTTPPAALWKESLVSSRLLEYEIFTRLHARRLASSHGEAARLLVSQIGLLELAPPVLARALDPFPVPVRTLDALHLASIDFLRARGQSVRFASYDARLSEAANRLGIESYPLT